MYSDRWREIESIFHAALRRKGEDRRRFLDEACADDALRNEVESLLSCEAEALQFLELSKHLLYLSMDNWKEKRHGIRWWIDQKIKWRPNRQKPRSGSV